MDAAAWWQSFIDSIKSQTATWLVGFLIARLTLFSTKITENIKLALNRADLVSKYYEELAVNLSEYRFQAELAVEFVERGWTTAYTLETLFKEYNEAITKLRQKVCHPPTLIALVCNGGSGNLSDTFPLFHQADERRGGDDR